MDASHSGKQVPSLENGAKLPRAEFERRYRAMPGVKAELIEGEVHMASPVRTLHGEPHLWTSYWMGCYVAITPGIRGFDNTSYRLDSDNEQQPDLAFSIPLHAGGRAKDSEDCFVEGSPDLIIEIASFSVSIDTHRKKQVYRRNGVREYIIWRVEDAAIDWFMLREGEYVVQSPDAEGLLKSDVFPGLWLDPVALLRGDLARVAEVVARGTKSDEHRVFAARVKARESRPK
jgi:Uma2 family endonuclease